MSRKIDGRTIHRSLRKKRWIVSSAFDSDVKLELATKTLFFNLVMKYNNNTMLLQGVKRVTSCCSCCLELKELCCFNFLFRNFKEKLNAQKQAVSSRYYRFVLLLVISRWHWLQTCLSMYVDIFFLENLHRKLWSINFPWA